ncbi:MAG: carbamoyltransferase HypF [Verrucomicrobiota bacterium]
MSFTPDRSRLRVAIRGAVQGVGFRPFVFRLASELGLAGWVRNSSQGVFLEVEGGRESVNSFLLRLPREIPPRSFIQSLEPAWLDPAGYSQFEIQPSASEGPARALVLPDIATCPDCLRDIFDPSNRRHHYPFTNCTQCGPRFSIIRSLPYDRANTTMAGFAMCPDCHAEYEDPTDRRFHAQPNACPRCGPRLEFRASAGAQPVLHHDALLAAAASVREGRIVAVKGLGGFHLVVDARNEDAVRRLRDRKRREEKPFALMFPDLDSLKGACRVSPAEERLLRAPEAPIVLLQRRESDISNLKSQIAEGVAPGNPRLGAMLPYTPLHHLLLRELGFPIVATSGNLSDEPICTDEHEALDRLGGIADAFLLHNRPIQRPVDDSVVRVVLSREMVLRRARGYAPLPIPLRDVSAPPVLAVGAHLKNTIALAVENQAFLSQHIGDLETDAAFESFRRVIADFKTLFAVAPEIIAADLHPDYLSTRHARQLAAENSPAQLVPVQHHAAHVLSCLAENELDPPALGVAWDGTGYGPDDTVWGGEFFAVTEDGCDRICRLRPFRLPGGDQAVREPRRSAIGLLHALRAGAADDDSLLPGAFSPTERAVLRNMLERGLNSPWTSSAGRLFDAVAALAGIRQQNRYEGQAAMELEFLVPDPAPADAYPFPLADDPGAECKLLLDWAPLLEELLRDAQAGTPREVIAARFHNALSEGIVAVARRAGFQRVVLSGGCFQNARLLQNTVSRLSAEGFRPAWHQRVPPNDGGIALGQIVAARRKCG